MELVIMWPIVTLIIFIYGIQQYREQRQDIEKKNLNIYIILATISGVVFIILSAGFIAMYMWLGAPVYIKGGLIALGLVWPVLSGCSIAITAYRYAHADPADKHLNNSIVPFAISIITLVMYYAVYGMLMFYFE